MLYKDQVKITYVDSDFDEEYQDIESFISDISLDDEETFNLFEYYDK